MPRLTWYDKNYQPISVTTQFNKYTIKQNDKETTLEINNLTLKDSGFYTIKAENGIDQKELKFKLAVKGKII